MRVDLDRAVHGLQALRDDLLVPARQAGRDHLAPEVVPALAQHRVRGHRGLERRRKVDENSVEAWKRMWNSSLTKGGGCLRTTLSNKRDLKVFETPEKHSTAAISANSTVDVLLRMLRASPNARFRTWM